MAQPWPNPSVDVQHYVFHIRLALENDTLKAQSRAIIRFTDDLASFSLNLQSRTAGKGMQVKQLLVDGKPAVFEHQGDELQIKHPVKKNEALTVDISYEGVPADGLIIGKNKFGEKTFFGDNWPNRARHWLPTVDHPADKATCEWIVEAPASYQVVANGMLREETLLSDKLKLTRYIQSVPIPTKVMVAGAAPFAVEHLGEVDNVPVQSWVFRQNRQEGFYDYALAFRILDTLRNLIGPYPFEKLANVQSKTRYGGMENAGNIFYFENSVTGQRKIETLIAHEIAHQWFGNSASEKDWHHIWLSEGFATYFAQVYMERQYGADSLKAAMRRMILEVVEYHHKKPHSPVVDTTIVELTKLLSTNSYQRGAWVLHMLRREVGDDAFFKGVREYYDAFKYSNALTDDFRLVMERVSGKDLKQFFTQWLFAPEIPEVRIGWWFDKKQKKLIVEASPKPGQSLVVPLEIAAYDKNGTLIASKTINMSGKPVEVVWEMAEKPAALVADPDSWLLALLSVSEKTR